MSSRRILQAALGSHASALRRAGQSARTSWDKRRRCEDRGSIFQDLLAMGGNNLRVPDANTAAEMSHDPASTDLDFNDDPETDGIIKDQ